MNYKPHDHFFKKAKQENFVARSVYKLEEIDKKYKLLKSNQFVLDLGAAPGSWSQYVSKVVGNQGKVVGIDLKEIDIKLPNAVFVAADSRSFDFPKLFTELGIPKFDVVVSDMAPQTTGIRMTDQARSVELCEMALLTAEQFLKPHGHFVCKLFHCDDFATLKTRIKSTYQRFEAFKPESTRKISKEIFLVGINKK